MAIRRRAFSALGTLLLSAGCTTEAIDFYQHHLGDQWAFHCDYQPSCSNYGKQAVATYGVVPGSLMIADRLLRDHDLAPENYPHDEQGRPLDPPAANALFGPADETRLAGEPDAAEQESERAPLAAGSDLAEQLRFADELFAAREFERARIEYLRLLRHDPATSHATRCQQRIALCLAKSRRRADALAAADRIADPAERDRTRALVLRELGRPADALSAAQMGSSGSSSQATSGGALFTGMLALEAGRADGARDEFARLDGELRDGLLARVDEFDELPTKSRWLAGSLSAVLPGSGQLYAGRAADGAVAFVTNALLIGGTIAAAKHDEDAAAIGIGFVAFGFYAGNIYGAVNAAARHDRDERDGFLARTRGWLRQSNLWLSVAPAGDGGALGLYFGF